MDWTYIIIYICVSFFFTGLLVPAVLALAFWGGGKNYIIDPQNFVMRTGKGLPILLVVVIATLIIVAFVGYLIGEMEGVMVYITWGVVAFALFALIIVIRPKIIVDGDKISVRGSFRKTRVFYFTDIIKVLPNMYADKNSNMVSGWTFKVDQTLQKVKGGGFGVSCTMRYLDTFLYRVFTANPKAILDDRGHSKNAVVIQLKAAIEIWRTPDDKLLDELLDDND